MFFKGSFLTMFSNGFLMILGTLWDLFFYQKARKTEVRDDSKRAWKKSLKKVWFLSGWNHEKWTTRAGGSMILRFCPSPEKN